MKNNFNLHKNIPWNFKSIYVIENDKGYVKIGCSKNTTERIKIIKRIGAQEILNVYVTEPCSNPYFIENEMHKLYSNKRIQGEWFDVNFNECSKKLSDIFLKYAEFIEKDVKGTKLIDYIFGDNKNDQSEENEFLDDDWFKDFNYLPSWHMSNYKTIEKITSKKNITLHDFYESMFLEISMYYNLGAAEAIYRKETGRTISCMTDLLGYFPELAEMANDFLNELDI